MYLVAWSAIGPQRPYFFKGINPYYGAQWFVVTNISDKGAEAINTWLVSLFHQQAA